MQEASAIRGSRSKSLEQLFAEAEAIPAGPERDAWVQGACGDDATLATELRELLDLCESSDSFMETPPVEFPPGAVELSPGQELDHYRIEHEIGRGGMGVVYRARDTALDRPVAIKTLPAALADHPRRLARLEQEARALAALNHPNVAAIHGLEQHGSHRVLVLEYVEGETLADRLDRGALPVEEALTTAAQIAAGVEAAHDAGVIHRDLKPANVRITPEGQVKVLDFGLAKADGSSGGSPASGSSTPSGGAPGDDAAARPLTVEGAVIGTAAYMSPEQARGRSVDRQTDVWAFGAILYECLTGAPLFGRETSADSIAALLRAPVTLEHLPPDTPAIVKDVLARCLQRDKDKRIRDIHDVRVVLEQDASALDMSFTVRAEPRRSRLAGAIALAVVLLVAAAWITSTIRSGSDAPPAAHVEVPISVPRGLFGGAAVVMPTLPRPTMLGGGRFVSADVSADGRVIAYVGCDPDDAAPFAATAVRVRSLGSPETRVLAGTERAVRVSVSPDGSRVAFITGPLGGPQLRCAVIDGGAVTTVLRAGSDLTLDQLSTPRWLTNSELLLVTDEPALWRVPIETAEPVLVATFAREDADAPLWHGLRDPVPLPGGESVLVTHVQLTDGAPESSLVRVDLDSGAKTPILADAGHGRVTTSGHLVFLRDSALCAAPFDLDACDVRGHAEELVTGLVKGVFAISEQGTLVYALDPTDSTARRIMAIDREGNAEPLVPLTGPFRGEVRVSPDGRQLAVNVLTAPDRTEVRVLDLESGALRSIQDAGPHPTADAGWTSDGRTFFHVQRSRTQVDLAVAGPDLVATGEGLFAAGTAPSWIRGAEMTRDGRHVIGETQGALHVFDLDGAREPVRIEPDAGTGQPALSPDGRWLAHVEAGGPHVKLRSFDAADPDASTVVWTSPLPGQYPFWSIDGSELLYIDAESRALMSARFQTDPEPRVTTVERLLPMGRMLRFERSDWGATRRVDALPDGRFVYIGEPERRVATHLQVVLNWFTELNAQVPGEASAP